MELIRKAYDFLLDTVYPRRCPVCGDIVLPKGRGICEKCANVLKPIDGSFCLKCGKPLGDAGREWCINCLDKHHEFTEGRSAFIYDDAMRKSIYRFKYNHQKEYASYYGRVIADILGRKIKSYNADALIPVPMYKAKERKRGFNQANLLAKELSRHVNIPVRNDIVVRKRSTQMMRSLGAAERENNIKNAFKLRSDSVKLKNVIIVDDIYTTGSTIDAVASVLRQAGVQNIYFVALATGRIE